MRKFIGVILALVAVFILLHLVLSNGPESNVSNPGGTASNVSDPSNPVQPTFSVTRGDTTYYGAFSTDVGVAILGVGSSAVLIDGFSDYTRADGKFVFVDVAVLNRQNTAITMDTGLFEIVDPSGNVYSASEKSMEVGPENSLFLAQINPGITKAGRIIFDVPPNLGLDGLRLRFRGGMTGESADIPLRVNSSTEQQPIPPAPESQPSETAGPDSGPQTEETAGVNSPPAPQPSTVAEGQTPQEVESILGPPTSVTLGPRRVYHYPHLDVVFADGKVSEIHQM